MRRVSAAPRPTGRSVLLALSLGATTDLRVVDEATAWAAGQGVMVVAVAEHEKVKQPVQYRATDDGACSVAASDPMVYTESNWGDQLGAGRLNVGQHVTPAVARGR